MKFERVNLIHHKRLAVIYSLVYNNELIAAVSTEAEEHHDDLFELNVDLNGSDLGLCIERKLIYEIRSKLVIGRRNSSYYFKTEDLDQVIEIIENFNFDINEMGDHDIEWEENRMIGYLYCYRFIENDENHFSVVEEPYDITSATIELTEQNILIHDPTPAISRYRLHFIILQLFDEFMWRTYQDIQMSFMNSVDGSRIISLQNCEDRNLEYAREYLRTSICPYSIPAYDYRE